MSPDTSSDASGRWTATDFAELNRLVRMVESLPPSKRNSGRTWADSDLAELRKLVARHTPTHIIALKLGRTPGAVWSKAHREGISLRPRR